MAEELHQALQNILRAETKKIILSNAQKGAEYRKIEIAQKKSDYQISKYTEKQVFHENCTLAQVQAFCEKALEGDFRQANIWDDAFEHQVRISKKGACSVSRRRLQEAVKLSSEHNRKKNYKLQEGESIPPLVDMGIFTKEGRIVQSMQDKFRQINKFIEILEDAISRYPQKEWNIIDFGCGKSYLTFIVYYYLHEKKGLPIRMTGLDLKADVIAKCNAAAKKYGYEDLKFEVGDINGYQSDMPIDMVISLHACDTATDFALFNAISWDAKVILSVPCCQHELCGQLESETLPLVQRYGIVKERTAALFTDAIRGNLIEACGYKVQLLEFVDLSHTPKNILIRATKAPVADAHKKKMLEEVHQMCDCFGFDPMLRKLLRGAGRISE